MLTLVVTDIFGATPAIDALVDELPGTVKVLDPYAGKDLGFNNEASAYQYFMDNVGLELYLKILESEITANPEPLQLLGFSVGASVCWNAACEESFSGVHQAICFYGSQIRHSADLNPQVETTVVLPQNEASFDVQALGRSLAQKPKVQLVQTNYLHGFMNPLSDNFSAAAYAEHTQWLKQKLDAPTR